MNAWRVITGDCRDVLAGLDAGSVHTCITSPPYFGLRDYGTGSWEGGDPECSHAKVVDAASAVASSTLGGGKKSTGHTQEGFKGACGRCGALRVDSQIGLEPSPDEFVAALVAVFRDVRRVLRDDGTVWLNLGDSYANGGGPTQPHRDTAGGFGGSPGTRGTQGYAASGALERPVSIGGGVKPKDLLGIPWLVAFALRADGWYLRSEIIWHKPNPMPESVTDRPTKAHEQVFLLSKSPRYYYDADAIREDAECDRLRGPALHGDAVSTNGNAGLARRESHGVRNKRTVWTIATQPYSGAHFATFPPKLIEPCVLAGCPEGGTVLDPFNGAGTAGLVALRHNRSYIGIELNPEYADLARQRIRDDAPLLNTTGEAA